MVLLLSPFYSQKETCIRTCALAQQMCNWAHDQYTTLWVSVTDANRLVNFFGYSSRVFQWLSTPFTYLQDPNTIHLLHTFLHEKA